MLAPRVEIASLAVPTVPDAAGPPQSAASARARPPSAPAEQRIAASPARRLAAAPRHTARRLIAQNQPPAASAPTSEQGEATAAPSSPAYIALAAPVRSAPPIAPDPDSGPSNVAERQAKPAMPKPAFGQTEPRPAPARLALPSPAFGQPGASTNAVGATALATRASGIGPDTFGSGTPFTEDDELILEIQTTSGSLSDTITAYGTRAGVYLPLGEFARLLDLAIVVSDDGRYASGWVLDEKKNIALNLRAGTLKVGDSGVPFDPREAAAMDGELYVRADLLEQLMPLRLKVDLRRQVVIVETLQPFPFEQRAEREAARDRLAARKGSHGKPAYPREATPWLALSFPLSDVELRTVSDSTRGTRGEADLRVAGDVAFMTGQGYLSTSTRDGLTAARIELGRRDPDATLLGPLHATQFEMGDVGTDGLPLGLRGVSGRGAMISNTPLERASVFDKIDLRGDLPAGYDAELYRNNTLIGSTRVPVNGQYEFLQVPVEFGLNVFRVVLYGPQGQRREDVRQISVGDGRLARGELVYSFGIAQKDVNLLGVRPPEFVPSTDYARWRATGQLQYGVSAGVTATLGGSWYESGGQRRWLATAGLRSGIGSVATRLDFGVNEAGGNAIEVGLGGAFAGVSLTATHAEYFGTFSDEVRSYTIDPLRRATEADLTATFHIGSGEHQLAIPMAARVRRVQFADGRVATEGALRASALIRHVLVSNSFSVSQTLSPGGPAYNQITGTFDLASLSGSKTQYRATLGYGIVPSARLNSAGAEIDRAFGPDTRAKASISHMLDSRTTLFGLSAIRRFGPFSLSFDGNVAVPSNTYSAVLRLGFSFGRNPVSHAMFLGRPGLSQGGAVAARAFEDENGNHRFDPGEPLLSDVTFDTGSLQGTTGKNGVTLIGGLGDATRTYLRLNAETLPDIAMAPAQTGVEIIPRPGRIHQTDFAVDRLSDIEGTAYFGAGQQGVSGLSLRLVDAQGKVVKHTRTSAGGVFLFEQLHPGAYRVELDPGQAGQLGLSLESATSVTLDGKEQAARIKVLVGKAP
ncbi:MAG: hypothetical protein KGL48_02640 [Sphingomonadales bacterium]|nr:hypothetical protein [Sphingomonadales bacterium]MDE2568432.1 hypothetical protein [Sphingomonadales bacterium]